MTIDTSPAALLKLADEYLGDYEDTKVMRDTLLAIAAEKEAQAEVEKALRRMLCVHTSQGVPYMDDGEAQCSAVLPVIDYMRDTPKQIQAKLFARDAAKLEQQHNSEPAPQHHPEQPREMAPPADVPLPAPTRYFGHSLLSPMYTSEEMLEHREAYAKAAVAAERERCAKICDSVFGPSRGFEDRTIAEECAAQIRAQQFGARCPRRPTLKAMEMREALELIAAPKRPDGTWNRDREACRQLAADALGRYNEKQKGM